MAATVTTPPVFFHLKLVAGISLAVGVLAALVLLAILTLITGESGESYGAIIRSHSLTRRHLGAAMLVAGLLLLAFTALVTCLIVLYSSFRVAGPLYRFGQNLQLAGTSDRTALVELRRADPLGAHADGVKQAVAAVRAHYAGLNDACQCAAQALAAGDAHAYAEALARLKQADAHVRR